MEVLWACYHVLGFLLLGCLLQWWNELWYVTLVKARWSNCGLPPGHLGFPFFGEMLTFLWYFKIRRHPDGFINSKICKYGDNNMGLYRSYLFGRPSIIISSPSLCKLVLHSTDKFMQQWPTTQVVGPNSVMSLEGPRHHFIKGLLLSIINRPHALTRMVLQIQPTLIAALDSWSTQSAPIQIVDVKKVTIEFLYRYFAGLELGPQTIDAQEKCFSGLVQGVRAQPWNFPGTAYYHALKCRMKITKVLRDELETRKRKGKVIIEESSDLMETLMQTKDKKGNHLSDEEVLDNVMTSIGNGYLGLSLEVTWSLFFLAKSPNVLQKLREENMRINKEKRGKFLTYEDALKLTYTNKVVEETLRLTNLSSVVFRKAIDDFEIKGYMIPKGWQVILWLRNLHINPTSFDDPMYFNPDRWNTRPRYGAYLPFGGGTRSCPGSMLIRVTLAIYLHHLSIGYQWEVHNPENMIKYLPYPTPDGVKISFSKLRVI